MKGSTSSRSFVSLILGCGGRLSSVWSWIADELPTELTIATSKIKTRWFTMI